MSINRTIKIEYDSLLKIAIKRGDLDRLLVPTDSAGRKCGVDNSVINKPYLLFFNLERCIDARVPLFGCKTPQVCVEKCPTTAFIFNEFGCNNNNFYVTRENLICQMGVNKFEINSCDEIKRRIDKGDCARWYLPSNSCKYIGHCFFFQVYQCHNFRCFFVSYSQSVCLQFML